LSVELIQLAGIARVKKVNFSGTNGSLQNFKTLVGNTGLGPFWKYRLRLFVGQLGKISNLLKVAC